MFIAWAAVFVLGLAYFYFWEKRCLKAGHVLMAALLIPLGALVALFFISNAAFQAVSSAVLWLNQWVVIWPPSKWKRGKER